ncbi:MAG TPA: molybdopterin-dependent oxidoreductase, partial [Pyrinomonadaceae bacterium]|nr:molybdopterin-dependent oxidoreductase [Pyrinomonadaceae bacterium]
MSFLGNLFNDPLYQKGDPRKPEEVGEPEIIVSPDTRRENRIPPGQSRTRKWPVLDAHGTPRIDLETWRFEAGGIVEHPRSWSLLEFMDLTPVKVYADFHCVTRWSRLDNVWGGVSTREFARSVGIKPEAKFVVVEGYDDGWTTNLPLKYFLAEDSLFAWSHDGQPIAPEHGGPVRLIVPQLY